MQGKLTKHIYCLCISALHNAVAVGLFSSDPSIINASFELWREY